MKEIVNRKKIFIAGGSGSLGSALIRRLGYENELIIFSRDESKHWTIKNNNKDKNLIFEVGDIRDENRIKEVLLRHRPNIILIAAALKHVDTCELSPYESIQTNITGTRNIVNAVETDLERLLPDLESVLMVSTDKACAPVNVYGMCKSISERLVVSRSHFFDKPKFLATRYGNVLESRGSIIPLFKHQANHAKAFTLTHKDMTRFVMTLDDSIDLIQHALIYGESGQTWIPKLKSMKILDLAKIFSKRYDKPVEVIGMRPGEKIHESLICDAESVRVLKKEDHYIIMSQHKPVSPDAVMFEYTSADDVFSLEALEEHLNKLGVVDLSLDSFVGKRIEEIRED
ncbi:MAG: polysaccharide biosynthesis protein [Bacteroidota bacterium]